MNRAQSTNLYTGLQGFNINVANVVAGIFAATGQDIASVHESSLGQVVFEENNGDLYASLTLPNLVIGTVGGGTQLRSQKICFRLWTARVQIKWGDSQKILRLLHYLWRSQRPVL